MRPLSIPARALLIVAAVLVGPSTARATAPPPAPPVGVEAAEPTPRGVRLEWNPAWPRFATEEYIATGVAAAAAGTALLMGPSDRVWHGGILADEAARDALRLDGLGARRAVRDVSDVMLTTMTTYPFLVDALIVAAWYRDSPDVATQMTLINVETLAVTLGVQSVVKALSTRERPYGRTCGGETPADARDCDFDDRYYSFFSGHAALSFASAALICTHHIHLPLHGGDPGLEAVPCVSGFVVATTTATLRIVADMHYLSDVLTGAAIGTLVGFGLPWLLHYRHGPLETASGDEEADGVTLQLVPTGLGLGAVGRF